MGSETLSDEEQMASQLGEVLDSLQVPKDLRVSLLVFASTRLNQLNSGRHTILERDVG